MLQTIREHTQGWIAGVIITIVIVSFALWGIHNYFVGGTDNSIIAEVNGTNISKEQLTMAYERLRRQVQTQYGSTSSITAKDETELKNRALQSLISLQVLKDASETQGFKISDYQVDNYLQSMPEFQMNGQFSVAKFKEILSSTLLSTSEFLNLIKTSLLIDQPKLGIIFTSIGLPEEATYTYSLVNQERDIQYIAVPAQYLSTQGIVISSDEIKSYYDGHRKDFMTPEQLNIEYIQLSLKNLFDYIKPTDAMLKNFYNENINAYTQPMQWKFVGILIPLSSAATLDDIQKAKQKMTDVFALMNQGNINKLASYYPGSLVYKEWKTLNQVPEEWQTAVASLIKPGQIAKPFRTTKGYVVVQALDVQEPRIQEFTSVRDKVRDSYVRQHAEEKFSDLRDRLADLTYEHPESLELAANTLNLPIITSELFTKEKGGQDVSQYKKVRSIAFSDDVLNLQNNSDVIQLNPETVIVLRVKSHIPSTLLTLSDISKQIENKLRTQQADVQLAKFANDLKLKLQSGSNPEQLAASYKLTWIKAGYLGRYATKIDSAILDLAFRLPDPKQLKNYKRESFGVTRLPNGFAIVALKDIKNANLADDKQHAVFVEQVQNSEGLLEYELYKQSQEKQANIKITAHH